MGDLPDYEYTAYIDEAGDDGLARVRPLDPTGSTEWFVISAVVVRASAEPAMLEQIRALRQQFGNHQRNDIHYRDLAEHQKATACAALRRSPLRAISVLSHKPNMLKYRNPRVEPMGNRNFFYCWLTRFLLERVTQLVAFDARRHGTEVKPVRVVFSENRGVSYSQMRAYFDKLRDQSRAGLLVVSQGDFAWEAYDRRLVVSANHASLAGLQAADIVASAMHQAVEPTKEGKLRSHAASLLKGAFASKGGAVWDFGVKMMPNPKLAQRLDPARVAFLKSFG